MIKIENKSQCSGCMACMQKCYKQCISMVEDGEGFLYPKVDETRCSNCHLCEKVCPVINQTQEKFPIKVYAANNRNIEILKHSSSGGIFTLLAENILAANGVVFGATFNDKWEVCHTYIESIEELGKFRGSKYVQSKIGTAYTDAARFLKEGRKVLFSGTPCQISGLKKYLCKEYEFLYCVDVICHGAPSPGIWRSYLDAISTCPKNFVDKNSILYSLNDPPVITGISFRDKSDGWRKFSFVLQGKSLTKVDKNMALTSSILLHEHVSDNLYMRGFLNNLYLRPSCHDCPARHGKSGSDILLGDFWGILRRYPDFYNPQGVSLVLTYSDKGERLFHALDCKWINATYDDALDCNINIEKNEPQPKNRKQFFKAYSKKGIYVIDKYCKQLEPSSWSIFLNKVNYKFKHFLNK